MDDYYSLVEAAVIALVKEHIENKASYFKKPARQVSAGDDTVLTEGFDYFLIAYPGAYPTLPMGTGVVEVAWEVQIEIFVRFTNAKATWANFKAFRSDVFNLFNVKQVGRTLNRTAGVRDVLLASEGRPIFYGEEATPNDPVFYSQQSSLTVFFKINRQ